MLSRARGHLTYANVVSTLCLFILLGGSAYAAAKITGKNVKDGSLTGADVKNNSLTGKDVKNLGAADFKGGALPTGPRGVQGVQGVQGVTGPQGPGATRIWVDTGVGKPEGIVYATPDFDILVSCTDGAIWVERRAPANVALNTMRILHQGGGSDTPRQTSDFLDGSPDRDVVAGWGAGGSGSGDAIIQSYAPGTDTARNFTVHASISDEGSGNCAAYGSVIPAN